MNEHAIPNIITWLKNELVRMDICNELGGPKEESVRSILAEAEAARQERGDLLDIIQRCIGPLENGRFSDPPEIDDLLTDIHEMIPPGE